MSIFSKKKKPKKTFTLTLDQKLFDKIVEVAKEYKLTKTETIRTMIVHCLEIEKRLDGN